MTGIKRPFVPVFFRSPERMNRPPLKLSSNVRHHLAEHKSGGATTLFELLIFGKMAVFSPARKLAGKVHLCRLSVYITLCDACHLLVKVWKIVLDILSHPLSFQLLSCNCYARTGTRLILNKPYTLIKLGLLAFVKMTVWTEISHYASPTFYWLALGFILFKYFLICHLTYPTFCGC